MTQTQEQAPQEHAKTTGEKYYGAMKFMTGEVFILGLTAAIAYVARYGKASYKGIPNYLQRLQHWAENKFKPLAEKGNVGEALAGSFSSMLVTSHGGSLFAPVMKGFENSKKPIVNFFNKHFGNKGELEAGQENLKHEEKETWGDVIKGRIAAMSIVWASFFAATVAAGKDTKTKTFRFEQYENNFGNWLARVSKGGEKTRRFGKILALDIFATTASLVLWSGISRLSAKRRQAKKEQIGDASQIAPAVPVEETPVPKYSAPELQKDITTLIKENAPAVSHAAAESQRKAESEHLQPNVG